MLNRFTQYIEKHSLCTKDNTVLIAVSGGLDSMVMLDLFFRAGFRVNVAHMNFQLRASESDRDRDFVSSICKEKGLGFHSAMVQTNNYATAHKLSIQMAARHLRYEWFRQLLDEGKGDIIATAHHLNDSVETIILNLMRGSATEGLTGVPVSGNRIIRPLMFATRAELEAYAAEQQIVWREDESNQSTDYQRNIVRHRIIPGLRFINPGLEHSLERTMLKAAGDEELIGSALKEWKNQFVTVESDQIRIDKRGLTLFKRPESLMLRVIEPLGFNFSHCIAILEALHHQAGKVFYSSSHLLVIDRSQIIITKVPAELNPVSISSGERHSSLGQFELAIEEQAAMAPERDPMVASLDKEKVSFPLSWRTWKEGDYFFPLGMKGRKKVSDFLIDLKLSLPDKQAVTVIESPEGIVCLPGFRIDDRFKVTEKTRSTLVFRFSATKTRSL